MAGLQNDLEAIGIKLHAYKPEKGVKCSVILSNFYQGNLEEDSEEKINEQAKIQAEALIKRATKNPDAITQVNPIVKRREVPSGEEKDGSKTITKVRALV